MRSITPNWVEVSESGRLFCGLLVTGPLGFPPAVAKAIWGMISASQDEEAVAFRFAIDRFMVRVPGADDATLLAAYDQFLTQWLPPDLIRSALTELVERGDLQPKRAAELHHRLDAWSTDANTWKW